jgi:hypothetical protein
VKMKIIEIFLKLFGGIIKIAIILAISSSILFVVYKGNQPMQVSQVPKGMTYFEFIADRIDAAKNCRAFPVWLGNDVVSCNTWTDLFIRLYRSWDTPGWYSCPRDIP